MKDEYEAITNAGFELQLDCPDLAMSRQSQFADTFDPPTSARSSSATSRW